MARGPSVLLLDDGELDDIQEILEDVGVPFARVRGGAIVDGTPPPSDLLISTPRRVEAVHKVGVAEGAEPMRLVVVNEDSNSLREQLRASGFDYLVRRPVHPEALRLLVLRCLYRGDERRREPRVAVGFEVSFRTGLKTRRAVLADLSVRGCRLVSRDPIDAGRRIRVNVPEALETGDPVAITGRVLRVDRPKETERSHLYSAAVFFDEMTNEARETLEMMLEDLALGPATLRPHKVKPTPTPRHVAEPPPVRAPQPAATEPPKPENEPVVEAAAPEEAPAEEPAAEVADAVAPEAAAEPTAAEAECDPNADTQPAIEVNLQVEPETETPPEPETAEKERRGKRRAAYSHTVPAFGKRALRVLVGRDLSVGGMRIDPLPGLELGDRLHLAIYGDAGESPFLVWATVHRDDGESGMALTFDALERDLGDRLERLVGSLPSVESLHDTEAQAMGTVMSEILPE